MNKVFHFYFQAFGVGVFEEEDDDVYSQDNLSNYDLTMSGERENNTYGWSGAPKTSTNKGEYNLFRNYECGGG